MLRMEFCVDPSNTNQTQYHYFEESRWTTYFEVILILLFSNNINTFDDHKQPETLNTCNLFQKFTKLKKKKLKIRF
jgi:hypothetical protein